jgi:hypothetical protein
MKRLFAALALIPSIAFADSPSKWTVFTKMSDGIVWEYKNGSLNTINGAENQAYWITQWRTHYDGKTEYNFVKIAVGLRECQKESGQIVIVDMTNTEQRRIDFVFDGGTLASNIAQAMCLNGNKVLEKVIEKNNDPDAVKT